MRTQIKHGVWGLAFVLATLSGCGDSETPPAETAEATSSESAASEYAPETSPRVVLETTHGDITLQLDAARAPETVRNFLSYVDKGHYDGTLFHQVEQGYVMLGGTYTQDMTAKSAGRPIRNEASNGLKNVQKTIAMARSADQVDSSTCQFFINLADNPALDHQSMTDEGFGYCVFGQVVEGWEAVEAIAAAPVASSEEFPALPTETVMIRSAKRLR